MDRFPLWLALVLLVLPWLVIALDLAALRVGIWLQILMLLWFGIGIMFAAAFQGR